MLPKPLRALWGDLSGEEFKRFGMLSIAFLFIIGTYWLMRPLKDTIFMSLVGEFYLNWAKIVSWIFIIPTVMLYSKLVDLFEKHRLFYVITSFYGLFFILVAYLLAHPTIGIANPATDKWRILGWVVYVGIESFGSIVVALFWSFVASTTDTAAAKRGYAVIVSGAQIGSIAGPEFGKHAEYFGFPMLALIVACGIFIAPLMIMIFVKKYPHLVIAEKKDINKKPTGMIEGLKLLVSRPYLLGILGITTLYEVIGTIVDFQMKVMAKHTFHDSAKVLNFLSTYAQCANGLALVFALIGTSFLIRKFGVIFGLIAFPVSIGLVVAYVWAFPMLWVFFTAMVIVKGLSYALNNPCKEIMWIPTSKDVKFKAKSWIDGFGGRSAKAAGAGITTPFTDMASLLMYGSIISLGIVGVWILIAIYVGRTNQKLVHENKIVE